MTLLATLYSWATAIYMVTASSGSDDVGGGFAIDTLERLLSVSPTLAVVAGAAFFLSRFQAREVRSKDREILYLKGELVSERKRNLEMDMKIEALTEQVRDLKDEVHWLRRHVPTELLGEEKHATEEPKGP